MEFYFQFLNGLYLHFLNGLLFPFSKWTFISNFLDFYFISFYFIFNSFLFLSIPFYSCLFLSIIFYSFHHFAHSLLSDFFRYFFFQILCASQNVQSLPRCGMIWLSKVVSNVKGYYHSISPNLQLIVIFKENDITMDLIFLNVLRRKKSSTSANSWQFQIGTYIADPLWGCRTWAWVVLCIKYCPSGGVSFESQASKIYKIRSTLPCRVVAEGNPIQTKGGADYTPHTTTSSPRFKKLSTLGGVKLACKDSNVAQSLIIFAN